MAQATRTAVTRERPDERPTEGGEGAAEDDLERAFDALLARAGRRLHALALALTGDRAAAEDVVQEALARVWRRRHALGRADVLDGYVWQAVRNLAVNRRARLELEARALSARAAAPARPGEGPDPERVARALASLAAEQREVVLLRLYQDVPFAEVAARVGAPLGTVHSRYRLALERLRPLLTSELGEGAARGWSSSQGARGGAAPEDRS